MDNRETVFEVVERNQVQDRIQWRSVKEGGFMASWTTDLSKKTQVAWSYYETGSK
jgi:hypothetical protein